MSIPTSTFSKAKSLYAGLSVVEITLTGGSTPIVFETRKLDDDPSVEKKDLELPDATGVVRVVRSVQVKGAEKFKFELVEFKRLLDIFGGALSGMVTGVCTLWIPDPQDATGKVALKSEVGFACTITRDGGSTMGDGDFSKATIVIESNKKGSITWTADAATT